jgi:DNA polymerase-3 subunit delta'
MSAVPYAPVPPWLRPATDTLERAIASDHLAHAVLLHAAPGVGGDWLATWLAARVLCRAHGSVPAPCGACRDCQRVRAGEHPDCLVARPEGDSKEIRIEQVRALSSELTLSSHGGGYKVGILTPVDRMNRFAANALLKTLEEPTPGTLLVLVAGSTRNLPATILSRCSRLPVRGPERAVAVSWLASQDSTVTDWSSVLDAIGNLPFDALGAEAAEAAAIAGETRRLLDTQRAGDFDPVGTAEAWARGDGYALRLRCLENWVTDRIVAWAGGHAATAEMRPAPHLPVPAAALNIEALFALLDAVREARSLAETPVNKSLVLERLLWRLTAAARVGRRDSGVS